MTLARPIVPGKTYLLTRRCTQREILLTPSKLLNQIFLVMLMGAGITAVIADPLDKDLMGLIKTIDSRDESTPVNKLLVTLHDRVEAMEELESSDVDMNDPDQVAIWKTVQVLLNKVIYTDSYLR